MELPVFASRSMSAVYVDLLGSLHWNSICRNVTAASSAEAEIYAMDECVKFLLELVQLVDFLGFRVSLCLIPNLFIMITLIVRISAKGLRHIHMRENRVRENIVSSYIRVCHVGD